VSWTRAWHKAGSALLLIAAGTHLSVHWRSYVATEGFDPSRREAMRAMQAHALHPDSAATLWTAAGFFSLAFALLLALGGTSQWVLAREADPRTLRRHALRNAVLCAGAALMAAWLHPLPQGVAIFALAAVLFALAAWPRPGDV
jgi:hypothetical protein